MKFDATDNVSTETYAVTQCLQPSVASRQLVQKRRRRSGTPHKPDTFVEDDPIILMVYQDENYLKSVFLESIGFTCFPHSYRNILLRKKYFWDENIGLARIVFENCINNLDY